MRKGLSGSIGQEAYTKNILKGMKKFNTGTVSQSLYTCRYKFKAIESNRGP
jgi:hypothetical protein